MTSYTSNYAVGKGNQDDETCMHALKLLAGFAVPFTIKAVIELGIMDRLLTVERAMSAEELMAGLPCPAPATGTAMVDRMLRFLASHSVVRCATESELGPDGKSCRRYAAAPVCKWFARGGGVESVVPLGFWMLSKTFMENWYVVPGSLHRIV
jgi:caffeic acid 3-O-methyltransferase